MRGPLSVDVNFLRAIHAATITLRDNYVAGREKQRHFIASPFSSLTRERPCVIRVLIDNSIQSRDLCNMISVTFSFAMITSLLFHCRFHLTSAPECRDDTDAVRSRMS